MELDLQQKKPTQKPPLKAHVRVFPLESIISSLLSHLILLVLISCLIIRIDDDKLITQKEKVDRKDGTPSFLFLDSVAFLLSPLFSLSSQELFQLTFSHWSDP